MSIDKKLIMDRISGIREDIKRLESIKRMSLEEFKKSPDNYAIAEYHLRQGIRSRA